MKITQKMILITSLFYGTALPQVSALTAENTILVCDMNDVVVNLPKSQWPVIAYKGIKLIKNKQDMIDLPKTLYYMRGVKEICDAQGNAVNGLTAQMITLGMQHPESARFIAPLLDIIESSRKLDKNVVEIIKSTELALVWSTNMDSLTYQKTAKRHQLDTIAIAAIVTKHPLSPEVLAFAQHTNTPISYRSLVEKYHNDKETDTIVHAPGQKPNPEYFEYVKKVIGTSTNSIFIDNKTKNITGYINTLPSTETAQHIGIHFKNAEQLINEFVKLGICD